LLRRFAPRNDGFDFLDPAYDLRKYRFARRSASAAAASGVAASVATDAHICTST
jgi:hypothetical protein